MSDVAPMPASTHVVMGWNGQLASTAALRVAVDLAQRLDAHVHVVHIGDVDDLPVDPDASDWAQQFRETVEAQAMDARALLEQLGPRWTYHAVHGRPSDVLADLAEQFDALMIVVGAPRGGVHSFIETFAGQSVSHQLTTKHGRPVLLVPEPSSA
ncbi:universal stress protein [Mycolicibacterium hodleri]|uniref:Universal stress protein n=1 Tax=Mycolicibacterium hodleri TaxID=49897 RepID=A0A502E556_9MYCO|nr:universal stress protein [Mycolicibacterium hodleri]TPG32868.1 universal stress protein [Mycolicibacterium hodleri]